MMVWLRKLNSSAIGLEVDKDAIRVVQLTRRFNRIHVKKHGEEKIGKSKAAKDSPASACRRLFSLLGLRKREVILHLDGPRVRHQVLELPLFRPEEIHAAIRKTIGESALLAGPAMQAQFLFSYHLYDQKSDKYAALVSYAHENVIVDRLQQVESAGLQPVMFGAGKIDVALAYALHEDYFQKNLLFVAMGVSYAAFVITQSGAPAFYMEKALAPQRDLASHEGAENRDNHPTEEQNGAESGFAAEVMQTCREVMLYWQQNTSQTIDKILFCGNDKDTMSPDFDIPVVAAKPLESATGTKRPLPAKFSLAAGLAMKKLFPELNTIDLLPAPRKAILRQQCEKRRSLRFILANGLLILSILLALRLMHSHYAGEQEFAATQYLQFATAISDLELLQKKQQKLQRALAGMQRLVHERSNHARLLQEISLLLPRGVWLSGLEVGLARTNQTEQPTIEVKKIRLAGWALQEGAVAEFLGNVEESTLFASVHLKSTTRIPASEVWRRTKVRKVPLISFTFEGALK